ncbi:hypothetical protein V8G54_004522 [Vigna mungo]|uniref:Uncharacterized protein n=1 Tax=Vigna mungo TaxID=3915 RepID=A0AAQ3PCQ5_VIGMU
MKVSLVLLLLIVVSIEIESEGPLKMIEGKVCEVKLSDICESDNCFIDCPKKYGASARWGIPSYHPLQQQTAKVQRHDSQILGSELSLGSHSNAPMVNHTHLERLNHVVRSSRRSLVLGAPSMPQDAERTNLMTEEGETSLEHVLEKNEDAAA